MELWFDILLATVIVSYLAVLLLGLRARLRRSHPPSAQRFAGHHRISAIVFATTLVALVLVIEFQVRKTHTTPTGSLFIIHVVFDLACTGIIALQFVRTGHTSTRHGMRGWFSVLPFSCMCITGYMLKARIF